MHAWPQGGKGQCMHCHGGMRRARVSSSWNEEFIQELRQSVLIA